MLSSMVSSLSGGYNEETTNDLKRRSWSSGQEADNSLEDMVPNGAIVAIQDVHQHMYFAVEGEESKYNLVGIIHYSILGEKALFRVKHHKQKIWNSSILWFSFISLHAKSDSGEPLRLNYHPGSGFVSISSTNDSGWSLWKTISCEPKSYKGDVGWELYNTLVKKKFYLINKKNDCGVAFVDEIPQFVRKPGNPFKFKVFHYHALGHNIATSDRLYLEASGTNLNSRPHEGEDTTSYLNERLPCIQIKIDNTDLTIVHELTDTKDKFPLLRGCINNVQINVQILSNKTRIMSTSCALFCVFDAQKNSWQPVLTSEPPESTFVTIQLSNLGSFATTSLHLSLSRNQTLAWRTRIMSLSEYIMELNSLELRLRRPQQNENVFAYVLLKQGDSIDDSMATFDAVNLSGGLKKALMSLSIGNFLFSFRPEIVDGLLNSKRALSVEWSDELKGGKAVCLSGIFDSVGRDVPIIHPDKSSDDSESSSAVALQEQKEIFLLPTVRVSNLLHSEIHVLLTETDLHTSTVSDNIGKQATIACGSTVDFYANPTIIYFTVTLTVFRSSCKPVNSSDWIKKLFKNKNDVRCLDIDLDFGGGKYFASLRLSRGFRGILEAAIFTPYSMRNNTDFSLFFFAPNQKPLSRDEVRKYGSSIPPELGLFCPPNSIRSWFSKSHKMRLKSLENHASQALLDLDALSGLTEISSEIEEEGSGLKYITKFGVSMGPSSSAVMVPSQIVTMTPRHVVYNESEETITIRQWLGCPRDRMSSSSGNSPLGGNASYSVENSHLVTDSETLNSQSPTFENLGFSSFISAPMSSHWFLINVTLSGIFVTRHSIKNAVVGAHQINKLTSLLSVGKDLQTISWRIQGGPLVLETTAVMMFVRCFVSYLHSFAKLLSIIKTTVKQVENSEHEAQEIPRATLQPVWELPEASSIDVSQFSVIFIIEDDSGDLQELVSEFDVHVELESANMQRKFMFKLSRMSIFSQVLKECPENENENQIPHFSSAMLNKSSSHSPTRDPAVKFQHMDGSHIIHQNYILNHLVAFVSAEKSKNGPLPLNQIWVGNGSVSDIHVTISLSEIQMLSSMVSSLSGGYNEETTNDLKRRSWSSGQEADNSLEDMVPNGAIVAIQDVHQHMYFAVEGEESKYNLVGIIHYSILGEKALFRVKHHKQKIWNSSILWFSFISLHAKSDSGEPLRLNYHPGSGFVSISSTNDSGWSLWKTISCEPKSYKGDVGWELYNTLVKKKFYLINKKNDCGVAFVDEIPQFVRKPGNPFKFKVFHYHALGHNIATSDRLYLEASGTNLNSRPHEGEDTTSYLNERLPCIQIKIDNTDLTIVHELTDTKDKFPLLRGCINNVQINVQILSNKTRIMSTSCALFCVFDAQKIHVGYISNRAFIRYTTLCDWGIKVGWSLFGEKLYNFGQLLQENQSGLNLLCHFYNNRSVTIARKQSASVFLRQPVLTSEPPESTFVTIQLSNLGSFATTSLHLSLSRNQTLAWRTRIMSLSDSRAYPGPFVVVDISTKSKDGSSVVVSPLTRIHNGTEFPMELRLRRPQQNENVFAYVLLKQGDSIDDSMATFDAVNLSGGLKKALMSLSIAEVEWRLLVKRGVGSRLGICASVGRDVPIIHPDKSSDDSESSSAVALQEQKEIFLLPTVRVSNLLHSEIHVLLTETDLHTSTVSDNIGKQATIACGSTVDFYANPTIIYFTVTLTVFRSSCKPVNSSDWIKKLFKNKNDVRCLDIDLDFGGGKYFASLRLSRGFRGILEAAIFTPYSMRNNTDFSLFFFAPNQKPLSRDEVRKYGSSIPPELGLFCPPNSIRSWFSKSHKMRLKSLENHASQALLDLDALSGLTEISSEIEEEGSGLKYITKFGVSMGPSSSAVMVPSQIVTMTPRHVVYNESEETITIRQCYLEDEMAGIIHINSKRRTILKLQKGISRSREFSFFENVIRKHRNDVDTSLVYIQFQLNEPESGWSGPVCIASLGCFFLKFRRQSNQVQALNNNAPEFAAVHVIEEGSTLGMHFYKPPNVNLPYRIENHLHDTSLTYYQKDSSEREVLGSDSSAYYVWDDMILPHKLVVIINGNDVCLFFLMLY
ncbi:hypothetical protein GH714_031616 [Hevea brasiliensis]|uniref:Vacuolar protein sorting-associated protein 13 VPS13 adaptor binding domain-containing protein n=1 Tax=Hevea brasiliensis TaxID=3981 RepID=A0A6A6L1B5_HEVBR|nr:hypothetical protein GH714_031616 [Hevea brasiliensis]